MKNIFLLVLFFFSANVFSQQLVEGNCSSHPYKSGCYQFKGMDSSSLAFVSTHQQAAQQLIGRNFDSQHYIASISGGPYQGYNSQVQYTYTIRRKDTNALYSQSWAFNLHESITTLQCPANSTKSGNSCTCNSGFTSQSGQCVIVDPCQVTQNLTTGLTSVLVQFDNVNVTASSLGTFIGQNVTTAVPINGNNCAATGQVTDCGLFPSNSGGGSTLLCHLSGTTYTGSTYTDQQTLFGLPKVDPEATPVEEQHGVCPAGQYGGNVNGQAVCVKPNGSANTTSSTTTNADGSTSTTTSTTSCVGDQCTETKTTSGTDAQGNSTGTSSTSTQADKATFCEDNPNDAACKSGTATASCDAFICDGDAVSCAMLKKQWQDSCKLLNPDNDATSIFNKAVAGTDGFSIEGMKAGAEIIDVGSFDTTGSGWSRSCPADKIINVPVIGSFTISFQQYCPLLNSFSMVLLSITLLACIMWCVKD